jgi:YesN/AraC family two-component response regulator
MGEKFRIVIAEDYTIVRQGLKSLLDSFSDFEVVGEAVNGKEAIESVGRLKPGLVLMDLSMPKTDGITAIKEIKRCLLYGVRNGHQENFRWKIIPESRDF